MSNAKIGVALVGGYLLGRTKKAKLAIGLGMFLAGKKLNLDARQLGALVANSPVLGPLNDQVRKELVDATKAAAGTALTQRMSGLADTLHERTAALNEGQGATGDETRDATGEAERTGDDEHGEEETAPAKPAKKSGEGGRSTTARRSAKRTSSASSTSGAAKTSKASGKGAAASSRARPATTSGRKAAAGARKKASGAARTAADRGGSHG
ncbi:hypothetical protein ACWC9R_26305 [Streptomyces sp. NPDC001219]